MTWPTGDVVFPGLGTNYEFIRLMGQGSSGSVALVRYLPLQRLEAVKTVRAGARQLPAVRRLEREGRVLGRLHHPGIVDVYRILTSTRSVTLVMEYLPGGDLQHAIDEGRLSGSERVQVLAQVADALTAAAAAGVVHRDVKPSNVLLDGAGRAVLADFGLARLPRDQSAFRTMAGAVTGTPLFMAPEQIDHPDSEAAGIDAYAFGVLAYRLLTDGWPYPTGTVADIILAHRGLPPTSPLESCPEFPQTASRALLGALRKDPSARLFPAAVVQQLQLTSDTAWDVLVERQRPDRAAVVLGGDRAARSGLGTEGESRVTRSDGDGDGQAGSDVAQDLNSVEVRRAAGANTGSRAGPGPGTGTGTGIGAEADPAFGIATGAGTGIGAGTYAHDAVSAVSAVSDEEVGMGPANADLPRRADRGQKRLSTQPTDWVAPTVYRAGRRVRPRTTAVLVGVTVGVLLAVLIFVVISR